MVGRDRLRTGDRQLNRALAAWETIVEEANWKHLADLRQTWKSADQVGSYTVFNIRHNRFRLITRISYLMATVAVEAVLTHAEYTRWSRGK